VGFRVNPGAPGLTASNLRARQSGTVRRTPIAFVVFPRPNLERPVPEFVWDAIELTAAERAFDVEVILPVPHAAARRLQAARRARRGAAGWPDGIDARLAALEPRPTLVPFVPVPERSIEAAAVAVAVHLVARRRAQRPSLLVGAFLDEGGYVAAHAARALGVPSLVTAHGTDVRALDPAIVGASATLAAKGRRSARALAEATDVVAVSRELVDRLARAGREAALIPFTARPERFPLTPRVAHGGPTRVLFVGRLSREKGADVALRALPMLHATRPAELTLVGPAAPGLDARALAAELGLGPAVVRFTGELDRAALVDAYAKADVVVLPSEAEGLPATLVEAMLVGRPVVASAVGGIPELVDAEVGRLIPPRDPAALAAAVAELAARPPAIERVHARARAASWDLAGPALLARLKHLAGVA
jgi:glycosyltransferase involved in cell wall biosynthesis